MSRFTEEFIKALVIMMIISLAGFLVTSNIESAAAYAVVFGLFAVATWISSMASAIVGLFECMTN